MTIQPSSGIPCSGSGSGTSQPPLSWAALWNQFDSSAIDNWVGMMSTDPTPLVTDHYWCELWYLVIINSSLGQLPGIQEKMASSLDRFSSLSIDTIDKFASVLFFLLLEESTKTRVLAIADTLIEKGIFSIVRTIVTNNNNEAFSQIKDDLSFLIDTYSSDLRSLTTIVKSITKLYGNSSNMHEELVELLNKCEPHVYAALSSQDEPIQGEWDWQEYLREKQDFLLEEKKELAHQWQECLTKIFTSKLADKSLCLPYLVQLIPLDSSVRSFLLSLDSIKETQGIALCKIITILAQDETKLNKPIFDKAVEILLKESLSKNESPTEELYLAHIQALDAVMQHCSPKQKKAALVRLLSQYGQSESAFSDKIYQNICTTLIRISSSDIPTSKIRNFFIIAQRICNDQNKKHIASHIKSALVLQGSELLLTKIDQKHFNSYYSLIMDNASSSHTADILQNLIRCFIEHHGKIPTISKGKLYEKISKNPLYDHDIFKQLLQENKNPIELLSRNDLSQVSLSERADLSYKLKETVTIYTSLNISPETYRLQARNCLKNILIAEKKSQRPSQDILTLAQAINEQLSSISKGTDDIEKLIQECEDRLKNKSSTKCAHRSVTQKTSKKQMFQGKAF